MRSLKTALNSLVSLLGVPFCLPPNFLPVVLAILLLTTVV